MLFCTPAPGLSHAGILACCTLVDLSDDEMHDLLGGYEPVPTVPEPTHLVLTNVEKVRGWLQQAEQRRMRLMDNGGTYEEIAKARHLSEVQAARVRHATAVEAIGELGNGRWVEFDRGDLSRYAVLAGHSFLFHIPYRTTPEDLRRMLAIYDTAFAAGFEKGMDTVRRPILDALGLA